MMNFRMLQTAQMLVLASFFSISTVTSAPCEDRRTATAFLPTWRLLSLEQKEQFIAGYLQGFSDAARLTDVAIGYIDENPSRAKESLTQLKRIYDSSGLTPTEIASNVDTFFAEPDNRDAALSVAVSSARATARSKSN